MRQKQTWMVVLLLLFGLLPHIDAAEKKRVALTFDDGPCRKSTAYLLQGLQARNVKATFFLSGYRIEEDPEDVRALFDAGQELGIHGQTHRYLRSLEQDALEEEIGSVAEKLEDLTGTAPTLLRPPGGLLDEGTAAYCAAHGLSVILWSVDPEDWSPVQRARTASRVVTEAKDGDIILLHDLTTENANQAFAIIDRLRVAGFEFCTVSELASTYGCKLQAGERYFRFRKETA